MEYWIDKAREIGEAWGPQVLAAFAVLILGWIGAKIATSIFGKILKRAKLDKTISSFASKFFYYAAMTFVLISAAGQLGIATGSFIAVIGAAGLAVGFALQGSLGNFASGVMIIMFRPFRIDDVVEVGGETGKVKEIHIFSTTLLRPDNKRVMVPNGNITSGNIVNYTVEGKLRVDMVFGIGYGDDIKKAKQILQDILNADERIMKNPAPLIAVAELADSSVNFAVRPWTKTDDYWGVKFDVTEAVKLAFDKEGISIPFPQTDVHLHKSEAA
ncbi:MAG: mechanosensitive ion channel family protein [Planctomycetota bacterium]|jgi:small conductance mechanosensitive channel